MKKTRFNFAAICFLLVLLFILQFTSLGKNLGQASVSIASPLESFFYRLGLSFTTLSNYKTVVAENDRLKQEIGKLSVDYIKLADLQNQNEYLKKELGFLQTKNYQYQMAEITGSLPYNSQVLILDQGTSSGLSEGLPVTVNQGVIVGKLIQVEENRSYLQLLTDTQSQLAATLSDLPGSNGLIKGQPGGSLIMDLIPQDKNIKQGDLVITSGLEEKIPRGLFIGSISEIDNLVGQIFKTARVTTPFAYQDLQIVSIIKNYQ